MRPLDRKETFDLIRMLVKGTARLTVAAPYFGRGALEQLGVHGSKVEVVVYCDLFSGGCNPYEIEKIVSLGKRANVRTVRGLHAKIYLTDNGVVIGSANPSANGLGFEGDELEGQIEACVSSDDPKVVQQWARFISDSIAPRSRGVGTHDIEAAISLWEAIRDRRTRSDLGQATLLAKMRADPEFFRDKRISVITYADADISRKARMKYEVEKGKRKISGLNLYEDWPEAHPGMRIIDFSYSGDGGRRISYNGFWQILEVSPVVKTGRSSSITLCRPIDTIEGLKLSREERIEIRRLIAKWLPPDRFPASELTAYQFALSLKSGRPPI